jgi:hypothetical protein
MLLHPTIHLELARERHRELLASAERRRTARAIAYPEVSLIAQRRPRGAATPQPAFEPGLEV